MGVTILTANHSAKVTIPYGSLQEFRGLLMQAYAQHLDSLLQEKYGGRTEFKVEEYDEIEGLTDETEQEKRYTELRLKETRYIIQTRWIKKKTDGDPWPNYEEIVKCARSMETMFQLIPGLIGLYKFVNHCDCEGFHSVGDCLDILETLTLVKSSFSKLPTLEINQHYFTEFMKVFSDAVKNLTRVDYH